MPSGYELRLIRYVSAIADTGSISAAATRLKLSQPTLTRQLGNLERALGVDLFERTSTGARPTPAGEVFLSRGRAILDSVASLDVELHAVANGYAGRLRLGFVGSAINGPLGPAIVKLRRELPQVDLSLEEAFDDRVLMTGIRGGKLDIAVHRLPTRDPRLSSTPWASEPLAVFLPDKHPLASDGTPLPVVGLGALDLIMWPRDSAPQAYDEVMALFQRAGAAPRTLATAHTVQAILALVAAGVGASVMAHSYSSLRRVGVRARPLADYRAIHYLTVAEPLRSPLTERALKVLSGPAVAGGSR